MSRQLCSWLSALESLSLDYKSMYRLYNRLLETTNSLVVRSMLHETLWNRAPPGLETGNDGFSQLCHASILPFQGEGSPTSHRSVVAVITFDLITHTSQCNEGP
jgi:hypothetical protein